MSERNDSTRRFLVADGPSKWQLTIEPGRAVFKPHWSWALGTLGLARLKRDRVFDVGSTTVWARRLDRKSVFLLASETPHVRLEFLDAVDGKDDEIADAFRDAGFRVVIR